MGTLQDSRQLGEMYGCLEEIDHFKLCPPDPLGCTKEDCGCHQDQSSAGDIIKVTDEEGCHRCMKECPAVPHGIPVACGCPEGMSKTSFTSDDKEYYSCEPEPGPTP